MQTAASVYTQSQGCQMKTIRKEMPLDFNLFLFGDDHEGSRLRYDKGFVQLVRMMNSEYMGLPASRNYGLDHGDITEAIMIDDKRYDGFSTKQGAVLQEISMAKKHREPIKKKLICIMEGNHPEKLWRFGPITQDVCEHLKVEYGTWQAIIQYYNRGRLLFSHYATHGYGSINSKIPSPRDRENSMLRSLMRLMMRKTGNCILSSMGHTHKLLICSPVHELYITPDKNGKKDKTQQHYTEADQMADFIPFDERYYVNTGSFYRTFGEGFSGYAERAGYDPVELGFAVAMVRKGKLIKVEKIVVD